YRSLLGTPLIPPRAALPGLLRFPRRSQRNAALHALAAVRLETRWREPVGTLTVLERARLALGRALARRSRALVLRDVDRALGPEDAGSLLRLVPDLAGLQPFPALASGASASPP